jgi:hypothetical protein
LFASQPKQASAAWSLLQLSEPNHAEARKKIDARFHGAFIFPAKPTLSMPEVKQAYGNRRPKERMLMCRRLLAYLWAAAQNSGASDGQAAGVLMRRAIP